jgi:GDP-D-mannose dehydratase
LYESEREVGLEQEVSFEELVKMMVNADLARLKG